MYKFNSKLNKSTINASSKYLIPTFYKLMNYIAGILLIVIAGFMVYQKEYIYAGVFAFFGIAFLLLPVIKTKQLASRTQKVIQETYGKDEVIYEISLNESGIEVENTESTGVINISYGNIKKFKILDNHYLLVTKQRNSYMLDKRSLNQESRAEFMKFIQRKLPQINWTKVIGR